MGQTLWLPLGFVPPHRRSAQSRREELALRAAAIGVSVIDGADENGNLIGPKDLSEFKDIVEWQEGREQERRAERIRNAAQPTAKKLSKEQSVEAIKDALAFRGRKALGVRKFY